MDWWDYGGLLELDWVYFISCDGHEPLKIRDQKVVVWIWNVPRDSGSRDFVLSLWYYYESYVVGLRLVGPGCWKWVIEGKLYKIMSSLILVCVSASWLTTMWEAVPIASTVRERTPYYGRMGLLYKVPSLTMMDWITLKSKSQKQPFSPETDSISYSVTLTGKAHNT